MKERIGLGLCALLIVLGDSASAQQGRVARVGVLISGSSITAANTKAFRDRLRELGYVEGQNLALELRYSDGKTEQLAAHAAEMLRLRVDVIAAFGAPAIMAAKQSTSTIPIVFETLADAVAMGFVPNLARPGGNITGVTGFASEVAGKWLELLRQVAPRSKRMGLISNPANPNGTSIAGATQGAAQALGLQLTVVEARNAEELDSAFGVLTGTAEALIVPPDPLFNVQRRKIAVLAAKHKLPTISGLEPFPAAGGLMFYGTTLVDNWRRAASYVDKVLKGAKPGDLPVERPVKFEFIINLKTARQIGVTIPTSLLARADRVIR